MHDIDGSPKAAFSNTAPDYKAAALVSLASQAWRYASIWKNVVRVLQGFRDERRPIVHVVTLVPDDRVDTDRFLRDDWIPGQPLSDPEETELLPEFRPRPDLVLDRRLLLAGGVQRIGKQEVIIRSPRVGAFHRTPLEEHLRSQAVSTVVFAGWGHAVHAAIYEANHRDFSISLLDDVIAVDYRDVFDPVQLVSTTDCLLGLVGD